MGQKIAVAIMIIITVVLLTYFFILVITGGKKDKLNFRRKNQTNKQNPLENSEKELTRDEKAVQKEELKKEMRAKRAEQKRQDEEYDAMVQENIKRYKEEYIASKAKLAELEASFKEVKARYDVWAKENPELVVNDEDDAEDEEIEKVEVVEDASSNE